MATKKPQFHCYLDQRVRDELDAHLVSSSIPGGKLLESMWRFFQLRDLPMLVDKMTLFIAKGIADRDVPHLYKLMVALQRALEDRK